MCESWIETKYESLAATVILSSSSVEVCVQHADPFFAVNWFITIFLYIIQVDIPCVRARKF